MGGPDIQPGDSGGHVWNNQVARNRVLEELKAQDTASSSFSELRQIAKAAIGEDIHYWIRERERVPDYEKRYRIEEEGLIIDGGDYDGKSFRETFITRPRELGPKFGRQPDEHELNRLELLEQAILSGQNQLVTATSIKRQFRYLEVWEVAADGVVKVRGMDIGKVAKRDFSEGATGKMVQQVLGMEKSQALDPEGLLFTVEKAKTRDFFEKATVFVKTHFDLATPSLPEVGTSRDQREYRDFDYSKNRSDQRPVEQMRFDPIQTLATDAIEIGNKTLKDTHMIFAGAGVFLLEKWNEKQQKKNEERKRSDAVQKTEPFFMRIWNKLTQKPKELVVRQKENAISTAKKLRSLTFKEGISIKKNLIEVTQKVKQIFEKPKKALEQLVIRVKNLPHKAVRFMYEKRTSLVKRVDVLFKKPLLRITERVVRTSVRIKEKAFASYRFLHMKLFSQPEKTTLSFIRKQREQKKQRWMRRIRGFIFLPLEHLGGIKQLKRKISETIRNNAALVFKNVPTSLTRERFAFSVLKFKNRLHILRRKIHSYFKNNAKEILPIKHIKRQKEKGRFIYLLQSIGSSVWFRVATFFRVIIAQKSKQKVVVTKLTPEIKLRNTQSIHSEKRWLHWLWILRDWWTQVESPSTVVRAQKPQQKPKKKSHGLIYQALISQRQGSIQIVVE